MSTDVKAIFLDVGNTLRIVIKDPEFQAAARAELMQLIGARDPNVETFFALLETRWKAYRKWSFENLTEACERDLWTKWLLPDYPVELVAPNSGRLTRLWRNRDGRRVAREDVKPVVMELHKRGYILGIIANTITETEIPDWLKDDDLEKYFSAVVLSSKVGFRKPGPEIYWEAAKRVNIEPKNCAYVGDNPVRDVEGTQKAGFAMTVILIEPDTLKKEPPREDIKPDYMIETCTQLLDIFPPRK